MFGHWELRCVCVHYPCDLRSGRQCNVSRGSYVVRAVLVGEWREGVRGFGGYIFRTVSKMA
jgi:hypothetical protein